MSQAFRFGVNAGQTLSGASNILIKDPLTTNPNKKVLTIMIL